MSTSTTTSPSPSTFTVLTDTNVQTLLNSAGPAEISNYANILTQALHDYSVNNESAYQPHRASVRRPTGQGTLFMPSTTPSSLGVKIVGLPSPERVAATPKGQPPPGLEATLTLCDDNGRALGVLNAGALTAFRTSLGAMLLFRDRRVVKNVVMFGSGKQALWHLKLAVILRGKDIERITVVNRSRERAEELVASLREDEVFKTNSHAKISTVITGDEGSEAEVEEAVRSANSIHTAVPSLKPLFPAQWVLDDTGTVKRDLYISAIGSYRLDMQELDPELIKKIISSKGLYAPSGRSTPVVVVDSRSGCFQEAGELVAAELKDENLLEIGELTQILEAGHKSQEMDEWLESGFLVYKSVGIGIMDICIGIALIEQARKECLGVNVSNF